MKDFFKNFYRYFYKESLIKEIEKDCPIPLIPEKTNREKLLDIAITFYNIDPTPRDEQPDEVACVHSLTTIIKKLIPDFPIMTYTPTLLDYLLKDIRFKETNEMKEGIIIISPTGEGKIIGHTGIIGKNGTIYSNNSLNGLWDTKYTIPSWIKRYCVDGNIPIYLFELL